MSESTKLEKLKRFRKFLSEFPDGKFKSGKFVDIGKNNKILTYNCDGCACLCFEELDLVPFEYIHKCQKTKKEIPYKLKNVLIPKFEQLHEQLYEQLHEEEAVRTFLYGGEAVKTFLGLSEREYSLMFGNWRKQKESKADYIDRLEKLIQDDLKLKDMI